MPIVFITGSGRRMGKGLAIEFARKQWDVAVNYNESKTDALKTVEEIRSLGVQSIAVKADVRDIQEMERAFETAVNELGKPDVLVNNAGIFPPQKNLDEISVEFWDNTMNVNLRGEFFASQVFSKFAAAGSRIINISSLGGLEVWKHRIPYNVSKAAVIQLTKALARELAPVLSVNAVCPGAILINDDPSETDTSLIDINKIPMKRYGNTQDIFEAVYFFATCSGYITGQVITVDGGYHDAR
ncbi:SDR family NAD(P)-dependent oxidoreductase [Bacteroidota bacterium]